MAKRPSTVDDATREGLSFNPMARTEAAQQEGDKAPKRQGDTVTPKISVYLPDDLLDELERRLLEERAQERAARRAGGDPQRVSRSSIVAAALRRYLGDPE